MTLAEFRGIKGPAAGEAPPEPAREAATPHERAHPGPLEYVKIGLTLGFVTAVEVAVYYMDIAHDALVAVLIVLSAVKFSLVALWFMHLRFDNPIFSTLFVGGMMLVMTIFIVVLATFGASLV